MEIEGKSVRRRVFSALFMGLVLFVLTTIDEGGPAWTFVLVAPPFYFVFELLLDVLVRRVRRWRSA